MQVSARHHHLLTFCIGPAIACDVGDAVKSEQEHSLRDHNNTFTMGAEDIIIRKIKVVCKGDMANMMLYENGSVEWCYDWSEALEAECAVECEIKTADIPSFKAVVSAVNPKTFVDMLTPMIAPKKATLSLDAFGIIYVCTKMESMGIKLNDASARKHMYMGMMAEAAELKSKKMDIVVREPESKNGFGAPRYATFDAKGFVTK